MFFFSYCGCFWRSGSRRKEVFGGCWVVLFGTLVGAMAFEFGVVFVLVLLSCFNVNSVESDDGECCSFTLPRLFFLLFPFWNGENTTIFKVWSFVNKLWFLWLSLLQSWILHVFFSLFFDEGYWTKHLKVWIFNYYIYLYYFLLGFFIHNQMGYYLNRY